MHIVGAAFISVNISRETRGSLQLVVISSACMYNMIDITFLTEHSQHNTEQCHKTHQRQMTPSAEPLTSCCSSARRPIAHTLSSCASYLQRHKTICDCVREYTALKLDSLLSCVCGALGVWDLGFVWSSDVRQTWLVVFS